MVLAPEVAGGEQLNVVVLDMQDYRVCSATAKDDQVVAGFTYFGTEEAGTVGVTVGAVAGDLASYRISGCRGPGSAGQGRWER